MQRGALVHPALKASACRPPSSHLVTMHACPQDEQFCPGGSLSMMPENLFVNFKRRTG